VLNLLFVETRRPHPLKHHLDEQALDHPISTPQEDVRGVMDSIEVYYLKRATSREFSDETPLISHSLQLLQTVQVPPSPISATFYTSDLVTWLVFHVNWLNTGSALLRKPDSSCQTIAFPLPPPER